MVDPAPLTTRQPPSLTSDNVRPLADQVMRDVARRTGTTCCQYSCIDRLALAGFKSGNLATKRQAESWPRTDIKVNPTPIILPHLALPLLEEKFSRLRETASRRRSAAKLRRPCRCSSSA